MEYKTNPQSHLMFNQAPRWSLLCKLCIHTLNLYFPWSHTSPLWIWQAPHLSHHSLLSHWPRTKPPQNSFFRSSINFLSSRTPRSKPSRLTWLTWEQRTSYWSVTIAWCVSSWRHWNGSMRSTDRHRHSSMLMRCSESWRRSRRGSSRSTGSRERRGAGSRGSGRLRHSWSSSKESGLNGREWGRIWPSSYRGYRMRISILKSTARKQKLGSAHRTKKLEILNVISNL